MNILFDIGHPAHVHLFKNLIMFFGEKGYKVFVVSREKDITNLLLNYYKINYISLSKSKNGVFGMISEMLVRDLKICLLHYKIKFDIAIGTSVSIGHLSCVSKVRSYNFNEDDDVAVPLYTLAAYPFCTKIINSDCVKYKRFRYKRVTHNSFQKLAYLHPDNFTPDIDILKKYNLEPYSYIVLRHSALKAHHDFEAQGIDHRIKNRFKKIFDKYNIITSDESTKLHDIEPWDMHHILFYAKLLITDSMSMAVESSVLGVPSVRYNSFVGKSSVLDELEIKFKLTYGFKAGEMGEIDKMYDKVNALLETKNLNRVWQKKREKMLKEKLDMNQWMINYFESEIKKII